MNEMLQTSEVFGAVFQGEGKNIGLPCFFLRLAGCNLHCRWCDSAFTWRFTDRYPHDSDKVYDKQQEVHPMTMEQVLEKLLALQAINPAVKSLVISGGEPMLQQKALIPLVNFLCGLGWWVEIETAGTVAPLPEFIPDQFTVSLKLENSGNSKGERCNSKAIDVFVKEPNTVFKFVVTHLSDLDEIDRLVQIYSIPADRIYLMPEGIDAQTIQTHAQAVARETIARGWRLTTRMQILLYGNQRGI